MGRYVISNTLSDPYFQNVLSDVPRIKRQYLTSYLAKSLSISSRLKALTGHYIFMNGKFDPNSFQHIADSGLVIWEHQFEDQSFDITLSQNINSIYEGDLLLSMSRSDILLSQASFSFVPGHLFGVSDKHALIIGSMQGAVPKPGEHALAVKANGGVAPNHLLIAAIRGIAGALDMSSIVGVANADQLSKNDHRRGHFTFDYDEFWPMFGAQKNKRGFFLLSMEANGVSNDKSSAHRRRSRKKAAFKAELTAQIEHCVRSHLRSPAKAH